MKVMLNGYEFSIPSVLDDHWKKIDVLIKKKEEKLYRLKIKSGVTDLSRNLYLLFTFGSVEVGWRESCGSTDDTLKIFREWNVLITKIRSLGCDIDEERVKHGNSYATNKGGFWNSIKYKVV